VGAQSPRTYNKALSVVRDFFKWAVLRGDLHGDPTLPIERAKARGVHRETFSDDVRRALLAENADLRDRVALRLLLDYGLRKGSLRAVQFKHFDHNRRRLTIFGKGGTVRQLPIPHQPFWHDLERLILDLEARPSDYLMARQKTIPRAGVRRFPDKPMSDHGLHRWWYGRLAAAGIVPEGVLSGERMHKARHTAGQRVLDKTGNLKAVQKLLGHASIQTTGDVYVDYDIDELGALMALVVEDDDA
jgi:site-specific recombinase XerC